MGARRAGAIEMRRLPSLQNNELSDPTNGSHCLPLDLVLRLPEATCEQTLARCRLYCPQALGLPEATCEQTLARCRLYCSQGLGIVQLKTRRWG